MLNIKEIKKHIKEYNEIEIINYLKENCLYDKDFYKEQLKEIKKYYNNINLEAKKQTKQEILTLKMLKDNNYKKEINNIIKSNIKINRDNIKKISKNFNYKFNSFKNFTNIFLEELFTINNLNYKIYKNGKMQRMYIFENDIIISLNILDLINIMFNKKIYKEQINFLENLFNYSIFIKKMNKEILDKNEYNLTFLEGKIKKDLFDFYKMLVAIEINSFNHLNLTKDDSYYFFASKTAFENISATTAQENLKMLCFIGLISVVDYENIYLEDEIRINKNNKFNNVNCYTINNLKEKEVKEEFEYILEEIKIKKIVKKDITERFIINNYTYKLNTIFNKKKNENRNIVEKEDEEELLMPF